jgi:hypothetical protein
MKVTGGCHCGLVRYEAEVDPEGVSLCNCTDCQTLTGSAFRVSVPAAAGTFKLLSGQLTTYLKTAESGAKRRHTFCPQCGTPVHSSANVDAPSGYSLRVGCLDRKADLPPKRRIWCRSALGWAQDVSGIPCTETQ